MNRVVTTLVLALLLATGCTPGATSSSPATVDAQPTLDDDGFLGRFTPANALAPAVVLVGGSEGGMPYEFLHPVLHDAGVNALSVAMFDVPGLPSSLSELPLETIGTAVDWVRRRPTVEPGGVWLVGASRGSEAVLLAAAHFDLAVAGVVAAVPSSVAVCSLPDCDGAAWTIGGEPVPTTRQFNLVAPTDDPDAIIPVEKIPAPIVTVCGGVDQVWNSCGYAAAIHRRRAEYGVGADDRALTYDNAGHWLGYLWAPTDAEPSDTGGGSAEANRAAIDDLWPRLLALFTAE